jgi:hypothetical protein
LTKWSEGSHGLTNRYWKTPPISDPSGHPNNFINHSTIEGTNSPDMGENRPPGFRQGGLREVPANRNECRDCGELIPPGWRLCSRCRAIRLKALRSTRRNVCKCSRCGELLPPGSSPTTQGVCRLCRADPLSDIPDIGPPSEDRIPRPCPTCKDGVVRSRLLTTCMTCDRMGYEKEV